MLNEGSKTVQGESMGPKLLVPMEEDTDWMEHEMTDEKATEKTDWNDKDGPAPGTHVWRGTRLSPSQKISKVPTVVFAAPQ
jgi:hypothetical protein